MPPFCSVILCQNIGFLTWIPIFPFVTGGHTHFLTYQHQILPFGMLSRSLNHHWGVKDDFSYYLEWKIILPFWYLLQMCVFGTLFGNFLNLTSLFLVVYQHLKVLGCMPKLKHALGKDVLLKWSCPVCSKVLKNNFVISNSKFPSFNFGLHALPYQS